MAVEDPRIVWALEENAKHAHGSRIIKYRQAEILAPVADITEAIYHLGAMDSVRRRRVMRRVVRSIERNFEATCAGRVSQRIAMNVCSDIALWFANEVVEGRETFSAKPN